MRTMMLGAVATLTLALGGGCASAEKKPDAPVTAKADADEKRDAQKRSAAKLSAAEKGSLEEVPASGAVYFHFDSAELLPEGRQALQRMATYLQRRQDVTLVLEGHCDERGTEEYNLSLGQKRAEVMRSYLERLGVKKSQLRAVSYGELKPAVPGSEEDAWAQNRRGEVKLDGMGHPG